MKRKILNIILIFMVACVFFYTNVNATSEKNATTDTPQKMIGISSEKNDDELSVFVNVNGTEAGILGMQGTIEFDNENLELINKEVLIENFDLTAFNEENGKFLIEINNDSFMDSDSYIHNTENILKLTFKVKNKAVFAINDIILVDGNFKSINAENVAYSATSGKTVLIVGLIIAGAIVLMILTKMLSKSEKYVRKLSQNERRKASSKAQ